jgi:Bacteriophage baseplate protein W
MASKVRYRVGLDEQTGGIVTGWAHVRQSLSRIWQTRIGDLVMLLDFGSSLRDHLGEDLTPALALEIYDDLVTAAHTWEPEFRVTSLRFVKLTETGALGLAYAGAYYPEGRFGNYNLVEFPNASPIGLKRAFYPEAA